MIKHTGELMLSCTCIIPDTNKCALPWVPPAFLERGGGGGGGGRGRGEGRGTNYRAVAAKQ